MVVTIEYQILEDDIYEFLAVMAQRRRIPERIRALHQGVGEPRVRRMLERQTSAVPNGPRLGASELAEPLTDPNRTA